MLRLPPGLIIIIAHNIDLISKVYSISQGDQVEFFGDYEWNNKGGVVYWTHKDSSGRHVGGRLKYQGKTNQ